MIGHRLNREFTVWRPVMEPDGSGGFDVELEDVGEIRAQVSQPTTDERLAAGQLGAALSHIVHTEKSADVLRGDLLDGPIPSEVAGARLRVLSATSDSRQTYTRLECEVVQAGG